MQSSLICFLICVITLSNSSESAKILGIFPFPSPSHYFLIQPLLIRLAEKGHEVTVAGLYPQKNPVPNFKDVVLEANIHLMDALMKSAAERKITNRYMEVFQFMALLNITTVNMFEDPNFKKLMEDPKGKFDLIIYDLIIPSSLVGLGEHFNASLIASSSFGTNWVNDVSVGNISPMSITPHLVLPYDSKMNYKERLHTFLENIFDYFVFEFFHNGNEKQMYKKYFPNAKLSYEEAISSHSLLLVNLHHSLGFPRPYVNNVIEIGGLHIPHNPSPLPKDMQQFLDNATHGAIYFSMGSNIKAKQLPIDKRNIILNVFRELKQKVLWKFEDDTLPNKPDNVFISPWCPQHSILKHDNVKVFITHGGLLSSTEAVFFGKPTLGIPMFADQPRNVALAVRRGIALKLDFNNLTEENFKHALLELLYNPKYMNNIKELSRQYHDKPQTAMESAEFWVEYVLRHNGAKFLQNASIHLNWFQFYSLDCIAPVLVFVICVLLVIKVLLIKCLNTFIKLNKQQENNKPKSN